jgi:hypothetical protein
MDKEGDHPVPEAGKIYNELTDKFNDEDRDEYKDFHDWFDDIELAPDNLE